jgi:hypothetical protein
MMALLACVEGCPMLQVLDQSRIVDIYLFEVMDSGGEVLRTASNDSTAVEIGERYRKKRTVGIYFILEIHQSFLFPLGLFGATG